jgi:aspartyl protease family protein
VGITFIDVDVGRPAEPELWETVNFLVDSGALYSIVPTPILDRLGIRAVSTQEFRLANGQVITRRKGIAAFRYGERIGGADVVFGEAGDANLLGAHTLESLGLALDPVKRELRELPMVL